MMMMMMMMIYLSMVMMISWWLPFSFSNSMMMSTNKPECYKCCYNTNRQVQHPYTICCFSDADDDDNDDDQMMMMMMIGIMSNKGMQVQHSYHECCFTIDDDEIRSWGQTRTRYQRFRQSINHVHLIIFMLIGCNDLYTVLTAVKQHFTNFRPRQVSQNMQEKHWYILC